MVTEILFVPSTGSVDAAELTRASRNRMLPAEMIVKYQKLASVNREKERRREGGKERGAALRLTRAWGTQARRKSRRQGPRSDLQ